MIDNSITEHKLLTNHTGTVVAEQVALHSAELDKLLLVLDTLPDWDLKQTHTYIYKNVLHVQNPCTYPSPALTTHLHYEADTYIFMPSPSQALTCQLSIITFLKYQIRSRLSLNMPASIIRSFEEYFEKL